MSFNKKSTAITFLATAIAFASGYVSAQGQNHADQQNHQSHNASSASLPQETGQSTFAAIAEIVAMLEADKNTDWSKINIGALREHLIDMNALTLGAKAETTVSEATVSFKITGDASAIRAAQNMVPTHSMELSKMTKWTVVGTPTADGAVMEISGMNDATMAQVKALGFFGLMATGAHHQPHHWAMANGQNHAGH